MGGWMREWIDCKAAMPEERQEGIACYGGAVERKRRI